MKKRGIIMNYDGLLGKILSKFKNMSYEEQIIYLKRFKSILPEKDLFEEIINDGVKVYYQEDEGYLLH